MASEWPAWTLMPRRGLHEPDAWQPYNEAEKYNIDTYIHRDAARAWQAFRDFLNGTPEQWQARCEQHFIDGQLQIALGHFPLHVRDKFEKRMTAEAIAQYERLQDHD